MKNNFSICIGRELGSGGREVAKEIARKMDIPFYDKEIINQAAIDSGISLDIFEKVDENPSHFWIGGLLGMGLPQFSDGMTNTGCFLCNDNLFKIQSEVMIKIASETSAVFVGRCADYVLREMPYVFSVFISAYLKDRVKRLSEYSHISEKQALSLIKECDKRRAEYYNYYTYKKWGAASSYDMCFNSSLMGIDELSDKIIKICESKWL